MTSPRAMTVHCNVLLMSVVALLTGCVAQPVALPQQDLPPAFDNADRSGGQWPGQEWYRDFGSDELNALVDFAVKNNSDLASARARVLQADARARQAGSAILPTLEGTANGNYLAGHSSQGSGHEFDWAAMLSASCEVDFWGKD